MELLKEKEKNRIEFVIVRKIQKRRSNYFYHKRLELIIYHNSNEIIYFIITIIESVDIVSKL
jgi:hypothetical protein